MNTAADFRGGFTIFVATLTLECYTFLKAIAYFSIVRTDSTWRAVCIIYSILSFQIIPENLAFIFNYILI